MDESKAVKEYLKGEIDNFEKFKIGRYGRQIVCTSLRV